MPAMISRSLRRAPHPVRTALRKPSAARLLSTNPKPRNVRPLRHTPANTPAPSSPATRYQTFRRVVLTGAVALVTAVGAITGARLKSDSDATKQVHKVQETTLDERIEILEDRRARLVTAKIPIERKLTDLQARMAEKRRREAEHESQGRGQ